MADGVEVKDLQKKCNYCKKKVVEALECTRCFSSYHKSCGTRVEISNNTGKFACCDDHAQSEVRLPKQRKNSEKEGSFEFNMDEKKLKNIIRESFQQLFVPVEKKIDEKFKDLERSIQFMSEVFEEQKNKFQEMMDETKALRQENTALRVRVQTLEEKFSELEMKERAANIIIDGVPQQKNPDTKQITGKIMQAMGLSNDKEIIESFRLGKKENGPILIKMSNTKAKSNILQKIRTIKGITVRLCGLEGENKKIYFNDDLSVEKRALFKKVRDIKQQKKYAAAFCSNGIIYLKRGEQDKPVKIKRESDVF